MLRLGVGPEARGFFATLDDAPVRFLVDDVFRRVPLKLLVEAKSQVRDFASLPLTGHAGWAAGSRGGTSFAQDFAELGELLES